MLKLAILATIEAKPGKEEDVKALLIAALALVQLESGTIDWFAFQITSNQFGIFDTFESEEGRNTHLSGKLIETLQEFADWFVHPPAVSPVTILAQK